MRRKAIFKPGYRGQALVEFALVLPVLMILALMIVQYGIIYRTAAQLTNLSREGARYAATSPASDSTINARIQAVIPSNIKYSDIAITVTPAQGDATRVSGSGGNITVKVSYDMSKKVFLPSTIFGVHIFVQTYTAQATFAIE